ncbi:MAG: MFS transporter [Opitutaceae bacterium]|jgi:MFS family permease
MSNTPLPDAADATAEVSTTPSQVPEPKTWRAGTLTYTTAGLVTLFCWLLFGDFAWSMRDRSVGSLAGWYLNHLGVPNLVYGLLMSSFPVFIGLIIGPIISVKSDRHRGRFGRRIPFLLVTTPLAAFGMLGLAVTPFIAKWVHGLFPKESELLVSVICFGVFWAAFEAATIAGGAVFGGLINDVVPKPMLGRFYGMFRAISLIDGMIFNFWLIGKAPEHFTVIMVSIGVFYGVAFTWVCLKVREGDYPPPPPVDPRRKRVAQRFCDGAKDYFRECFSKPYYVLVFVMMVASSLVFFPVNVFAIPYARSLGLDMDVYGKFLALTYLISLCLSYFLGWLADLFHPLRMAIATMLGYLAVALWGGFYATTPNTFLIAWVLHGVLSGCYLTSAASLTQRLFPQEKFAQFHSASSFIASPVNLVFAPLIGALIDQTGNTYRYTFVVACLMAMAALVAASQVHRRFMRLGGPKGYRAP